MQTVVLPIILAILSSTAVNTIIVCITDSIKEKKRSKACDMEAQRADFDVLKTANMFTMLYILKDSGKHYIEQGYISAKDREAFMEMHKCYKDLGGDGYADAIKAKVEELEIKI